MKFFGDSWSATTPIHSLVGLRPLFHELNEPIFQRSYLREVVLREQEEARRQSMAESISSCCVGFFKFTSAKKNENDSLGEAENLEAKINKELVKRLRVANEKSGMPTEKQVKQFIEYMLTYMHLNGQSSKSVTILTLIYIERLIALTRDLNESSFAVK